MSAKSPWQLSGSFRSEDPLLIKIADEEPVHKVTVSGLELLWQHAKKNDKPWCIAWTPDVAFYAHKRSLMEAAADILWSRNRAHLSKEDKAILRG